MTNKQQIYESYPNCKIVDNFIERFNNGEVTIKPEATYSENGNDKSVSYLLSDAITKLTIAKSGLERLWDVYKKTEKDRVFVETARQSVENIDFWRNRCLSLINYVKSNGWLIETESMYNKLKKVEQEKAELNRKNANLQEINGRLTEKIEELKKENIRLHTLFPDSHRGQKEVGGLDKP